MRETSVPLAGSLEAMEETLRRMEQRLESLEQWRSQGELRASEAPAPGVMVQKALTETPEAAVTLPSDSGAEEAESGFDLALIGRTLIVLGGAYLLRAVTEGGYLPAAMGVAIGMLYALFWSVPALRPAVSSRSATWFGVATALTSLPLIFESVRKFQLLGPWSSALALSMVTAVMGVLVWRRRLEGLAWTFTLMALALTTLLMLETKSIVPYALYLTALGVGTLWLGYALEWTFLRWVVALETNIVLAVLCSLVATNQVADISPAVAIAVVCVAFAAYLSSFAVRTLLRERDAVPFEIAQTLALLVFGMGGAMWVAVSRSTLELPLALAMIALAAGSYAVSFAFIPRHSATPRNFVFYSSLALMLLVVGGAFITRGLPSSILFASLAIACAWLSVHYRKSSLALHAAVYLVSGFVGAGLVGMGFRALALNVENGWPAPDAGMILLLVASAIAAAIRPIERQGSFELWTAAKVMILAELVWIGATLVMSVAGPFVIGSFGSDPAVIAVVRTALLAGLTILTAWASRFPALSPGRLLCNPLMLVLGLKLLWDDFRTGRPGTLFVSLAIVGVALVLTPKLRRGANVPARS